MSYKQIIVFMSGRTVFTALYNEVNGSGKKTFKGKVYGDKSGRFNLIQREKEGEILKNKEVDFDHEGITNIAARLLKNYFIPIARPV